MVAALDLESSEKLHESSSLSICMNDLRFAESNLYEEGFLQNSRATMILDMIDFCWTEHLERMTYLRETISWRSYGQQNPLTEYNVEAGLSFKLMFDQIRFSMIYSFLNNPL